MRQCPLCKQRSISKKKLFFKELFEPFYNVVCNRCQTRVVTKEGPAPIFSMIKEIGFIIGMFISGYVAYLHNFLLGLAALASLLIARAYFRSRGKLEF